MVWHFIGVYIINRTLHDRLEIRNFSSSVEKYFTSERSKRVKYFSTLEEKFRISARPCNILYLLYYCATKPLCFLVCVSAGNISESTEQSHQHHHGANEHGHTHEFMSNPGMWLGRDKLINRTDWKQVGDLYIFKLPTHHPIF